MRNGIKILNVIDTKAKAFTMDGQDFTRDVPNFRRDDDGAAKEDRRRRLIFWRFESRDAGTNRTNRPEWNTGSETRSGISMARSGLGTMAQPTT